MWKAFQEMGLDESQLRPVGPIYRFANQPIRAKGVITLPITIGQGEHTIMIMANFLVVDQLSAYNAIIGRPLMKKTNMVTIVYCLIVKFSTSTGIRYIKVDQAMARQCHIQSIHLSNQVIPDPKKVTTRDILAIKCDGSKIRVDDLDPRENYPKSELVEQTKEIEISGKGRTTQIGTLFDNNQKKEMEQFLRDNSDVFAWSAVEMPGISPSVICHSLNVTTVVWPVKQKKRIFAPDRISTIRQEIAKLLKADFIRKVYYPDWLSNVVMAKRLAVSRECVLTSQT